MRIAKLLLRVTIGLSMIFYTMSPTVFLPIGFAQATSGVPNTIGYQGRLKNSSGVPVTGTYDFKFYLYNASSGGTALATETHDDITVTDGYFSANLDFSSGDVADFAELLYLGIDVKADAASTYETMGSRVTFNSVAYSFFTRAIENASSAPATDLFEGRVYYNTTDNNIFVYDGSAWKELSQNLDDAYDAFGSAEKKITVDDATYGIEYEVTAAGNYVIDLQSTGDFIVQDAGTAYATFSDAGAFTVTDSSSQTLLGTTAAGVTTIGGTAASSNAIILDVDGTSGSDIFIDAYDATNNSTGEIIGHGSAITLNTYGSGGLTLSVGDSGNFVASTSDGDVSITAQGSSQHVNVTASNGDINLITGTSGGTINLGATNDITRTINIGTTLGSETINIGTVSSGTSAADIIAIGNNDSSTSISMTSGTGGVSITSTGTGDITLD